MNDSITTYQRKAGTFVFMKNTKETKGKVS